MNCWKNVYRLKNNTTSENIWDCIRETIKEIKDFPIQLPDKHPKNICFETEDYNLSWLDEDKRTQFELLSKFDNKTDILKIIFYKESKENKKNKKNYFVLYYEETVEIKQSNENEEIEEDTLIYILDFFKAVKKYVPKSFINKTIKDDTKEVEQEISQIASSILNHNDCNNNLSEKNGNELNTPNLSIEFIPNFNGEFCMPENKINQLAEDLWFLNITFIKKIGMYNSIIKALKNTNQRQTKETIDLCRKEAESFLNENLSIRIKSKFSAPKGIKRDPAKEFDNETYSQLISIILSYHFPIHLNEEEIKSEISELLKDLNEESIQETIIDNQKKLYNDIQRSLSIHEINDLKYQKQKLLSQIDEKKKSQNEQEKIQDDTINQKYEELRKENDLLHQEISNNKNIINEQQEEISNLKKDKLTQSERIKSLEENLKQQNENRDSINLHIPCSEKDLFHNEIEDFLYYLLYTTLQKELQKIPQNKNDEINRKKDICKDLVTNKTFEIENSETYKKLKRIDDKLKTNFDLTNLKDEGFQIIEDTKGHPKFYFYNNRYKITSSSTPSDSNASRNAFRQIREQFFLFWKD